MYRIYSKVSERWLFPHIKDESEEGIKKKFESRLIKIVKDRVADDLELAEGVALPSKVDSFVSGMTFDDMMDYCDYEIRWL